MKDKFQTLQPWLPQILQSIKKEIKTEHLSKSPSFYKAYFGNRPLNRITGEEICGIYQKVLLEEENDDLREWIINRWVFRNGDIYQHFAERLSRIHPDFDSIVSLDEAQSEAVLAGSIETFGALPVYLFCVLNGVVFPETVFSKLRKIAENYESAEKDREIQAEVEKNLLLIEERYKADVSRLERKYEDKLAGVIKKHAMDVQALKKQIRALQQQLKSE